MPSLRRRASSIGADLADAPQEPDPSTGAIDTLIDAEAAEAEAVQAEAIAAAARARARAIRLRSQAHMATRNASPVVEHTATDSEAEAADTASASADDRTAESLPEQAARTWQRISLRSVVRVLAVGLPLICIAASITVIVTMVINHRHQVAEQQRRADFAAAARQSVVTLMSVDFNKAKDDVQRIVDNSTGQFREDFKNSADDFIKVAQDSKVITKVNIGGTAVESMKDDSAVVLVSATSRVTNAAGANQEPRSWRLSVNLERDGGQIKMSKVEFVP